MTDLNFNESKTASLLYLREDKIKKSLNSFFDISKYFEKVILNRMEENRFGIADIKCFLIISLNPGIIFNQLMNELDVSKQSLNRVLKKLINEKLIIQKINNDDARKKNLYLSNEANDILNQILQPLIINISKAFQNSGSNSVQGFNQIIEQLLQYEK